MGCISEVCFYGLEELSQEWQIHRMMVQRWIMTDKLRAHLWLPVQSVYKVEEHITEHSAVQVSLHLAHFQGMISITHKQCQRLFRTGVLTLREFYCTTTQIRYKLPETSDDIQASGHDILILAEERIQFEQSAEWQKTGRGTTKKPTQSFRNMVIDGQSHSFGEIQAAVIERLYLASLDGDGWVFGKVLLQEVGSESFSLSNIFKRKPIWKQIIESDGRGRYRFKSS